MQQKRTAHQKRVKNIVVPGLLFSAGIGAVTGALIFLFKVVSSYLIHRSEEIYAYVRQNPHRLWMLLCGALVLGLASGLILWRAKDCRGGGIPTAVASIRGLVPMRWLQSIFVLFLSSMCTYLGGVPLGNEGPSVQMGTAVGKGATECIGHNNRRWERYTMTGGACAGFAAATGAPLTGVLFALEEAHRRFTPMLFMVASVSVTAASIAQAWLSYLFSVDTTFFDFVIHDPMPARYLWAAILIGLLCGLFALFLTWTYRRTRAFSTNRLGKVPFLVKIVLLFVVVAVLGFFNGAFIGSGHSLIESLIEGHPLWYVLLAALLIRALLLAFANGEGVTGGVFVPTLALGAILAAIVADVLVSLGAIDPAYRAVLIAVGMTAFLAASSRTPVTALAFAAEALCGVNNIIPLGIGVTVAYLIVELSGTVAFTDTVIEAKAEYAHQGRTPVIVDTHMVVQEDSFAVGKETRDILWPPTCAVLSVDKSKSHGQHHFTCVEAGDVLHLHYQTYDPEATLRTLTYILGEQPMDPDVSTHLGSEDHCVPLE